MPYNNSTAAAIDYVTAYTNSRQDSLEISLRLLFSFFLIIFMPPRVIAADGVVFYEVNVGYLRGDYGTTTTGETVSTTIGIGYERNNYDIGVSVPYLSIDESSGYSEKGIGDTVFRSSWQAADELDAPVNVRIGLLIKAPTADNQKDLGTGELDFAGFFVVGRHFSSYLVNVLAGYMKVGDSPTVDYDDIFYSGIAVGRTWYRTGLFAGYQLQIPVVNKAEIAQTAMVGVQQLLALNWFVGINATIGLSPTAPDIGGYLSLSRRF